MKYNRLIILVLSVFILFLSTGCSKKEEQTYTRQTFAFGTFISITIYDHGSDALLDSMVEKLNDIESKMSKNIETSEISAINGQAGISPVTVTEETYHVIEEAIRYSALSEGAFDVTLGPIVDLWQIGTDQARVPAQKEIDAALVLVSYEKIQMMEDYQVFLEEEGMVIDLGGIAKGYAADVLVEMAVDTGVESAIINLGGNVKVLGSKADEEPFNVGIQNPFDDLNTTICIIKATDATIVTSGDYERFFIEDGIKYHHIFDYKTGYPSVNEIASISIIASKAIDADALSTAIFVLGKEQGMALIESIKDVECIVVTKEKKIYLTQGIINQVTVTDASFELMQ